MAILSKACKPDNFESHNSLKLSFTNIRGLCSNFVDCKSFLESNSPDILLCLRQTWMTLLILAIYLERLSSFNPKRFQYSYAWSCSLCEGRTSFCRDFSLMFSAGFTLLSVLLLFPLSITFFIIVQFLIPFFFLTAIWLPHDQIWAIIEGTASLTQC